MTAQRSYPGNESAVRPCAPAEILDLFKGGYISIAEAIAALEPAFVSPTLPGQIAAIYGELDAEDCAFIDRAWAKQRGYVLPADGTSQLATVAQGSGDCGAWQPIETAPFVDDLSETDPERILVWVQDGGSRGEGAIAFGYAFRGRDGSVRLKADGYMGFKVTLWRPLPAGPSLTSTARATAARPTVIGKVSGNVREADQVPGMPHAICHACGLGYKCMDEDCPNEKPNPMFGGGL